ncbi:MAG: ACT domain-containing protein [Rhizobiaceae bacterium]
MGGGRNLGQLLASMRPSLRAETFVFVTLPPGMAIPAGVQPVMTFIEAEGPTLIIERDAAGRAGVAQAFPCRMITLEVHSSLEAVGFLAEITARLAAAGIPVNPVSAFHHDHLFIPDARAEEALTLIEILAAGAAGRSSDEDAAAKR